VRHWNRLPKIVDLTILEAFKARLDGTLSNLVYWELSMPTSGELEQNDFKGPFQAKPFYDFLVNSMNSSQNGLYQNM